MPMGIFSKTNTIALINSENNVDENLFYALGLTPNKDNLLLILKKRSKPILFVSPLEMGNYNEKFARALEKAAIKKALRGIKNLGLNYQRITLAQKKNLKKYCKFRGIDISKEMGAARKVKTQKEIKKIKVACGITQEILEKVPEFVKKQGTERKLAAKMEFEAANNGAAIAFPTIIASGRNSAIPHHTISDKKISSGFLVVDFGVKYEGYCSDLSRTFFVGQPDERDKKIFSTVLRAKAAATKKCFEGNNSSEVHRAAEEIIKSEFKTGLMHSVGHGIGLNTHDYPEGINSREKFELEKNMCLTIEPGHYLNGYGGARIEDVVVIKKRKCLELTRAKAELIRLFL